MLKHELLLMTQTLDPVFTSREVGECIKQYLTVYSTGEPSNIAEVV